MDQSEYTDKLLEDSRFMQALYHRAQASLCYSDAGYLELNPDVADMAISPFEHCCHFALRQKRRVSKYFDPVWYHRQYCAPLPACNPVVHFFSYGIFNDFKGSPATFDSDLLSNYSELYFDRVERLQWLEFPWKVPQNADNAPLSEQDHLLFVVHELLPTGASFTLLQAMRELAQKPGLTLWSLLMRPGVLEGDFCAVSRALSMSEIWPTFRFPMFAAMQIIQAFAAMPGRRKCLVPNTITIPKYYSTLAGLADLPAIPWIHELPGHLPFHWENNEIDKLCQEVLAVMTSSRFCGEKLSGYLTEKGVDSARVNIEVTGTPVASSALGFSQAEAGALRLSLGLPAEGPLVLGCGYVSQVKGTDIFTRVAELAAGRPDVTFAWAGDVNLDEDQLLLESLRKAAANSNAQLRFLGRVENMWPLYAASSLFLCTSRVDSFPRVVLEAKLAGLPVVCLGGNNGAVECLAPPLDAIIYPEDPAALLQAVLQRLPEPGGAASLPVPVSHPEFSPSSVADTLYGIIKQYAFAKKDAQTGLAG